MPQSLNIFFIKSIQKIHRPLILISTFIFFIVYISSYVSIKNMQYLSYFNILKSNFIHLVEMGDIYQLEREIYSLREGAGLAKVQIIINDDHSIASSDPRLSFDVPDKKIYYSKYDLYFIFPKKFHLKTKNNTSIIFSIYDTISIGNILFLILLFSSPIIILFKYGSKKYSYIVKDIIDSVKNISISDISTNKKSLLKFSEIIDLDERLNFYFKENTDRINELHALKLNLEDLKFKARLADLSTTVAHDIRAPVFALQACLSHIEDGSKVKNLIARATQRIQDIADNLLSDYKKQIAVQQNEFISLNLPLFELLEEKIISNPSIKFNMDIKESIFIISSERVNFERVISNILQNSIEAVEHSHGIINISCTENKLIVSDNGKGISAENLQKIFSKGFTFGKQNGTGIGLSSTKEVITKMGGDVSIHSVLGVGTAVTIALPTVAASHKSC